MAIGAQPISGAVISVANPASSGEIPGTSGSASFTYDQQGEFLAVVVTVASGVNGNVTGSVTFGGTALTLAQGFQDGGNGWSAIYYLTDPAVTADTLAVQLTTDHAGGDPITDGAGAWEFGAISLSGVDKSNPIAMSVGVNANGLDSYTLVSPTAGAISAGDLLLIGNHGRNTIPDPNWTTADGLGDIVLYSNDAPTGAGNHEYNAQYSVLSAADLSGANLDQVVLSATSSRVGARSFVVFNAIPEPASLSLLGVAGFLFGRRRVRA